MKIRSAKRLASSSARSASSSPASAATAQLPLRRLKAEQTGISNPYLSQIERGRRRPSARGAAAAVRRLLRVSAETLLRPRRHAGSGGSSGHAGGDGRASQTWRSLSGRSAS